MKVTFDDCNDMIHYRIHDFDEKYEKILQMCFYEKVQNGYIKKYPKEAKYLDKMMKRYSLFAEEMFNQLGYFVEVPWEKGLDSFCSIIEKTDIDWWLAGSCAACIREINLKPHDIDIMVNSKDISEITEVFKNELIEPIIDTNGWFTKDFGVLFLHCRIDIASDPSPVLDNPEPVDCGPYAKDHLETIQWRNHQIKIPPLTLQIAVNKKRGRFDRVEAMESFLEK